MSGTPPSNFVPGLRIRPMSTADVDRVMAIASSLLDAPHWPREVYESCLQSQAILRRVALVAETGAVGALAGFAVASLIPTDSELETIGVDCGWQRLGVGRKLWQALIGCLVAGGAEQTFLEVRASNQRAQAFYRSLGFLETGRRRGYYLHPVEDAIILRCKLPEASGCP